MSIVSWFLLAIGLIAWVVGLLAGLTGFVLCFSLITKAGLTREAALLVRIVGLQYWLVRYLTPDGMKLRNRILKLIGVFLLAWLATFGSWLVADKIRRAPANLPESTNVDSTSKRNSLQDRG